MFCYIPNIEANNMKLLKVFETEALNVIESLGRRLVRRVCTGSVRLAVSQCEEGDGMTTGGAILNIKSELSSHLREAARPCSSALLSLSTSVDVAYDCSLQ